MKQHYKNKINQHESIVPDGLFDAIIQERKSDKGVPPWVFWTITTCLFSIILAVNYTVKNRAVDSTQTATNDLTIILTDGDTQTVDLSAATSIPSIATTPVHSDKGLPFQNSQLPVLDNSVNKSVITPKQATKEQMIASILVETDIQTSLDPKRSVSTIKTPHYPSMLASLSTFKPKTETPSENVIFSPKEFTQVIPTLPITLSYLTLGKPALVLKPLPDDCYAFGRKRRGRAKIFIDVLGSPDYVIPMISAKSSEFQNYVKERAATEEYQFSYSGQIGLGLETARGLVFRLGANYSRYATRFRKSDPSYKKITIEQIYDNNGNFVRSDTVVKIGSLDIQHHNKHQFIGIPLTIGYTTQGKKLDFGLNVGVQFNIQTTLAGRLLGSNGQTADFLLSGSRSSLVYKKDVGLQGIANFTIAYEITDRLDLIVAPHLKFMPKSMTITEYPLTEKLWTTGLWMGARFRF